MGGFHHWLAARMLPAVPEPILWRFSRRYIAGPSLDDAARTIRELMGMGCCATLDVLGEDVTDPEETRRNADLYVRSLDRISSEDLDSNISIKLTSMGLKLDMDLCIANVRKVVGAARRHGNFVRIDMEDSTCTDATLDVFRAMREAGFDNVGAVLQSRLRRTLEDVEMLAPLVPSYRLCKGIYLEPPEIAFQDNEAINRNFLDSLKAMFETGSHVGVATHDPALVAGSEKIIAEMGLDGARFEFQMLLGVAERLRDALVARGHKMRIYVPFGRHWRAYSLRRLRENPEIVGHLVKNLFFPA